MKPRILPRVNKSALFLLLEIKGETKEIRIVILKISEKKAPIIIEEIPPEPITKKFRYLSSTELDESSVSSYSFSIPASFS